MPRVDVAMAARRNLAAADKLFEAKMALSSWDSCMEASFCKWPVIAAIVVGCLVVGAIVWCLVRRLCCGLACCCSFCRCCKCCGNCCGCCDAPGGGRRRKYLDEPYIPPHHGYQAQAPMNAPFASAAPPQYAEFDVSKKAGDDSLPAMPSWESGASKKVMVDDDEVEMDQLNKAPAASSLGSPSTGPTAYASSQSQQSLYSSRDHPQPQGYGYYSANPPLGPAGYGHDHAGHQAWADMPSEPAQPADYGPRHPQGYGMSRQGTADSAVRMGSRPPYGMSPGPGPRADGPYGPSAYDAGYAPGPRRQHSPFAQSPPQSPITNNAGFDFTSGYSRPANYEPASRTPPAQEASYPGYKPYQPSQ